MNRPSFLQDGTMDLEKNIINRDKGDEGDEYLAFDCFYPLHPLHPCLNFFFFTKARVPKLGFRTQMPRLYQGIWFSTGSSGRICWP